MIVFFSSGRRHTRWTGDWSSGVCSSGLVAAATKTHLGTPTLDPAVGPGLGIFIEAVLTVFLVWTVFGTAVSPNAPKIAGFGIGLIVAADILVGGPLTGAAMNPARHFGPAVVSGFLDNWYVYWLGPLIGAALAGLSYRYVFSPEAASFVLRPSRAAPQPTVPPSKDRTERI